MSDELLTTIKLVVDAAGVQTGVTSARREIADLGRDVKKITDETNAALKQVGSDTDLGKGVSKATKSAIKDIGDLSKQIKTFETDAFNGFSGIGRSAEAAYVKLVGGGVNTQIADQYVAVLKTAQGLSAKQAAEAAKAAEIISSATKRQIAEEAHYADLKKQWAASNKAQADQEIAATKARTAALAAYYAEARNAELNLIHTGRGKSSALLTDKGLDLGLTQAEISNSAVGKIRGIEAATAAAFAAANPNLVTLQKNAEAAGTSMKGFSASMRNVPAQFTDIVVSLQGGQQPLTVLLQQGGQLKDMFGGVGNAARALGGYVLGLINPFTIVAAAVGTLAVAYFKGSAESEAYNKTLILTGNAVGTTANRMSEMARAIDATSFGITQSKAAEVLNNIAVSGGVSAASLQRFTAIAIEFERAGAGSADSVGKAFSDLANDPLSASEKLNKSVNYLTLDIYNQIKALEDQGRTTEAASVAQSAYASEMESRIPKLVENLGSLQQAWMSVKAAASEAWDFMLNVGREDTSKEKMQAAFDKIKEISGQSSFTITDEVRQIKIDQQLAVIAGLEKEAAASAAVAAADKSRFEATQAGIALSKSAVVYETDVEKMRRKTMEATVQYETALRNTTLTQAARNQLEKDYLQTVSGITKVKEKSDAKNASAKKVSIVGESEVASIKARIIIGEDYLRALKTEGIATKEKNEGEKLAIKIQKELEGGLQGVALANKQKALSAAQSLAAVLKESDALKELLTAQRDFEKLRDKEIAGQEASIVKMEEKAQAMEDDVRMYGLGKEAIEALSIARLQERIDILGGFDNSAEQISLIEKEIDARKRLAVATDAKSGKVAADKYADDLRKANQKAAEESSKYWEDALMRAFESGKGFFESLWDTIKNTLKTQVLKVTVQGVMGSLGVGAAGVANAGGDGIAGLAGTANTISSLYSGASSLVTVGSQVLAGTMSAANALGTIAANATGTGISGLLATNAAYGTAAGTAAGAAAGAGASAGASAGVSSALAAVPVWGWGALAGLAVLSMSGGPTSTRSTGYASRKYGADGSLISSSTDANGIGEAGGVLDSIYKSIAGVQASLGAKGGASITYNSNTGRESADPQFYLKTGSYDSGEIQKNDANVSLAISRTILTAIQDSELPKYLQGAFDGMVAGSMSQAQINAAITDGQALKLFNDQLLALPFANLADLSFAATQNLIGFSGGLDQLKTNLGSYYTNFYSAEEQRAQTVKNINAATAGSGLDAATATRDEFRAIVESFSTPAKLATDEGQKMFSALIGVSGAFAGITEAGNALSEKMKSLKAESATLNVSLLRAKGDTGAADKAQYTIDTTDLTAAELAVFDYNVSLKKQIEVETQRAELQDQLNALTETSAQTTTRARDAVDSLNLALYDTVTAAQAAKDASVVKASITEKYSAPMDAASAAQALGPDVFAAIAGKSAAEIKAMAVVYVSSLDAQTEAGRAAITAFDKLTPAIDFFVGSASSLVESVGISANTIGDTFRDVLLGRTDAQEAGAAISKMVTDGIYNSLANGFAQQITQTLMTTLITPMVQAAAAGSVVSASVSQDAIDSMLASAKSAAQTLGTLFADEGFKSIIAGISATMGDLTQALVPAVLPITALAPAADAAASSVTSLSDALKRMGGDLNLRADLFSTYTEGNSLALKAPSLTSVRTHSVNAYNEIVVTERTKFSELINKATDDLLTDIAKAEAYAADYIAQNDASVFTESVKGWASDLAKTGASQPLIAKSLEDFGAFFKDLGTFGTQLEKDLAASADTAVGKSLNLVAISEYYSGVGAEIENIQTALDRATLLIGNTLTVDAVTAGFATQVGDAATLIGSTISASILASVPDAIKNDPALAGVSTSILATIGSVKKDDVQGLDDAFLLLTGNFADGKLTDTQYATAIGLITDAFKTGTEAAKASAESIEDAYKRLRDAAKTNEQIAQEKISLEDRLYAATDTTAQALERARSAIDPYNRALYDTVLAAESAKEQSLKRAELERQILDLSGDTAAIRLLEIAGMDAANVALYDRIDALKKEASVTQERNGLMTSLYGALGNTGALRAEQLAKLDPSNRALQSQIFAIEDAKSALEKALAAEAESAQAAQQAAQERVDTIKSIFDALKSNVDSLYESVETTKQQAAQQANAFIDNALNNARATGYLPESDALNDAISGARGGLDKQYVSDFERQRDTLVLAGKLAELQDISGGQLTIAEQQLKAAEDQVEGLAGLRKQGQDLLDSLSGNTAATLSIVDAIAGLSAAVLGAGKAAPDVATAAATKAGVLASEASGTYGGARPSDIYAAISAAGSDSAAQALAVLTSSFNQGVDKRIYDQYLTGAGFSSAQDVPGYIDFLRGKGVPGFAGGGMHSGGLRWVGENGPELEATGPSRIWNAQQLSGAMGGGNTERLESLIEGLTNRVAALQAELVAIKTNTGQMAEQIDEVTEGGNAMRQRAVGVGVAA